MNFKFTRRKYAESDIGKGLLNRGAFFESREADASPPLFLRKCSPRSAISIGAGQRVSDMRAPH
ncbi:MAG: hypothetical protein B6D41_19390 [Chloroflexi bacterium UTCFX4]|nr:MAG: hypothetical protein B6D41_19390 [Chloroflexi bacterium UTCFX4]